jgi:hypothetical protein
MRLTSSVLLVEDDEDHTLLMRRALDRARVANPLIGFPASTFCAAFALIPTPSTFLSWS